MLSAGRIRKRLYRENVKCFSKDFWFNSPPSASYKSKIFPRTVFIKEAVIPKERKMKKTTNPKLTLSTPPLIVPKDVGWSA